MRIFVSISLVEGFEGDFWMLKEWGRNFEDCFRWEVGNEKTIKFWEDYKILERQVGG